MAGTKRERKPGVWELRAALGKGPDGRYRQASETFHGTAKEADRALRRLVVKAEGGELAHRHEKGSTGDVLERWFKMRSPDLSPTTTASYRSYLDNHIIPTLGKIPVDKLTTQRLDEFYAELRAKGLALGSVRVVHAIINKGLQQAKKWSLVPFNVASDVTLPTWRPPERNLPTVGEALSMVKAVEETNPEYATWLFLMAAMGCRRGEQCGLRWSRVDLDEGTVTIARSVIKANGRLVEKDTKSHAVREVALPPVAVVVLRRHRAFVDARAEAAGTSVRPDGYVFSMRLDGSEPWRPDYATYQFRKVREALGLRYFRQHDLRHLVTTILMAEIPAVDVAARMGWSDPSMLFRVYGHPTPEQDRKAARIMGRLLDAKKPHQLPPAEGIAGAADDAS